MSLVHVVKFGAGTARRYLAQADGAAHPETGHRPFVWTRDVARAEKFSSAERARAFALKVLGHSLWDVVLAPMRGLPTDHLGGTPVAARVAA